MYYISRVVTRPGNLEISCNSDEPAKLVEIMNFFGKSGKNLKAFNLIFVTRARNIRFSAYTQGHFISKFKTRF